MPKDEAATIEGPADEPGRPILSERLELLLDEISAGRAPSAGRFCGHCYHPLSPERDICPHCGRSAAHFPPAEAIPPEVIEMHRRRRGREGMVVRSIAWAGLTIGVLLSLLPFVFGSVSWWTAGLFFGILLFFYVLSANLANSVGDAIGYRWGQSLLRRRWERFVRERDASARKTRT